jgi:hypothetical protein
MRFSDVTPSNMSRGTKSVVQKKQMERVSFEFGGAEEKNPISQQAATKRLGTCHPTDFTYFAVDKTS